MINEIKLGSSTDTAFLLKNNDINQANRILLMTKYLQPLLKFGVTTPGDRISFIGLPYPKSGNIKKDFIVPNATEILEYCDTQGITTLVVGDAKYFMYLSGQKKLEDYIGEKFNCVIPTYEHITILPIINHNILTFSPAKIPLFTRALEIYAKVILGTYVKPGTDVITEAIYPKTIHEIKENLDRLLESKEISIDIETHGDGKTDALRHDRGVLSTIAISDSETTGIAFPISSFWTDDLTEIQTKYLLKDFIEKYSENVKMHGYKFDLHNGLFDAKYLIYSLWMEHSSDWENMYKGIEILSQMDDTMVMAYLCSNSTSRVGKGLKELTKDFLGNYSEDVKNIRELPLDRVLEYNLKDTCGTLYVANKYRQILKDEEQEDVYYEIFKPSFGFLLEMMMTGLPVSKTKTEKVKQEFQDIQTDSLETIKNSHYVKRTLSVMQYEAMTKYNSEHVKQKTEEDFKDLEFKPNSSKQMQILLFDILKLEVKETTETGAPSIKASVVKEYKAEAEHNGDTDVAELLDAILNFIKASKMLSTFIKAIEELSDTNTDGETYLKGLLKLGGTQSGRLSSSEPLS